MKKLITIALILFSLSLSAQLKSGLVGYWKFENNALDATMHDNDGTVNGATYTSSGKVGGCYNFDGTSDNVKIPYVADLFQNEFAVSLWIDSDITNYSSNAYPFSMYDAVNDKRVWALRINSSNKQYRLSLSSNGTNVTGLHDFTQTVETGWHHIVLNVDNGNEATLFYDGSSETLSISSYVNQNTPVTIGGLVGSTTSSVDGLIDEVMIYNRALTATEVGMLYNSGSGVYFVMENFKKDKDYEKLNDYMLSRMYFNWIEGAA